MSHTPPAPSRLYDLREWLLDRIDGSEETRGDDSLISHFIRQIDALPSEIAEPKGCPTPGACSAVEELADLKQRILPLHADFARTLECELIDIKQRILPQFQGRAQRAEHERDGMLEQLIVHRTTIANLHSEIDGMRNAAPSATTAPPEEIDELGKYDDKPCGESITLRRQWWSGGTWLDKGDRVVVLRSPMKGEKP